MRVDGYGQTWEVEDVEALEAAMSWRDTRGGGIFWLSHDGKEYPCLAIRVSGEVADVHFFPDEGHPGFRCLGGEGMPDDGSTNLVFPGCDPYDGEETPNWFIVPFERASSIAKDFRRHKLTLSAESWFEL